MMKLLVLLLLVEAIVAPPPVKRPEDAGQFLVLSTDPYGSSSSCLDY